MKVFSGRYIVSKFWLRLSAIALLCFAIPSLGVAQESEWIDFSEETFSRLIFDNKDTAEKKIAVGDIDNDGDDDVVIARRKTLMSRDASAQNMLLINDEGKLYNHTEILAPGFLKPDNSRDVALLDVNNDEWLDVIVVASGQQPRLFINRGQGVMIDDESEELRFSWLGLEERTEWYLPEFEVGPKFHSVAVGDVTGDGFVDLYFVDSNNTLEDRLLINDGAGRFVDETDKRLTRQMSESHFGTSAIIADWNKDGVNDILKVTTIDKPQAIRLLINNADNTGYFESFQDLPYDETYVVEAADFNNDNRLDLYVVSDGRDYIIWNKSTNEDGTINVSATNISSIRTDGFGGHAHAFDIDGDGFRDIGVCDVDMGIDGLECRTTFLRNRKGKSFSDT